MRILLSNDDGIDSPGLKSLYHALIEDHQVVVVAPDRERSAAGHSLTLHHPLRVQEVSRDWYSVDGTPTDCVHLALNGLLSESRPEMVVAGINMGANLGSDITYSGTVAAAVEGTLSGVPSIAVSLVSEGRFEFEPAAELAANLRLNCCGKGPARGHPIECQRAGYFEEADPRGPGDPTGEECLRQNHRRKGRPPRPEVFLDWKRESRMDEVR